MKLLRAKITTTVFFCLVVATVAFADDYHYINTLVGSRASGLAGAYTAVSEDPEGCFYNPAGIAFAAHNSLSASVNAFSWSKKTYKGALTSVDGSKHDWEQESFSLLPNFFGIVRKFGPGMLGISYAVPDSIQRRQKQTFNNITSLYDPNNMETYKLNIDDLDKTYLFGPSYAYPFSDSLSVGATLYVYYRDREVIRNHYIKFDNGEHYISNYYETKTEWGCRPSIGAIWEPLDKLAIGLSLSKIYVTSSDYETQTISRNTAEPGGPASGDTDYIELSTSSSSDKDEFPLSTSLGVAYFASPKLLFSGDIKYYDKVSEKEATYNLALGAEYYFTEALAGRAGLFTDNANTPDVDSGGSANQPEHVDIYGASLSLSLFHKMSSITLGASYGWGKGDAQIIAGSNATQDAEIRNLTVYVAASYSY